MRNTKSIIGIVFILVGLILVSIPLYQEAQEAKKQVALEEALSRIAESNGDPIDLSSIDNLPFTEEQLKGVLELEIPVIGLRKKVLNETTEENLNVSLTQIKENQTPGKGNFTIAGHRGYRDGRYFHNLPEVPIGEEIYLHAGDQTFVYTITSSEVIEPAQVDVLDDTEGKNEITLITCTIGGSKRFAIKGELAETIEN